jgi:hypothetical protein
MNRQRPKKLPLTPLQNKVLWMLEEAGGETLKTRRCMLPNEKDLDIAIASLATIGFVRLDLSPEETVVLTKPGRDSFGR